MSIEAMKLALEALEIEYRMYEATDPETGAPYNIIQAVTALRQAIEQEQKQEPVAGSNALMLANWLQANYEADEIDESAEELRKLYRENQLLWQEREDPHKQLEFYIRECNRLEAERDAALKTQQAQKPEGYQEPVAWMHWLHGPVRLFLNKDEATMELDRLNREYPVDADGRKMRPLVFGDTSPPQRQWVGLTWEEIDECFKITPDQYLPAHIYKRIETKLKQKNGYAKENT